MADAPTPAASAPAPTVSVSMTPQQMQEAQAREQVRIEQDLAKNPRDETIPGGLYRRMGADGKPSEAFFNAQGEECDKTGKVKKTE